MEYPNEIVDYLCVSEAGMGSACALGGRVCSFHIFGSFNGAVAEGKYGPADLYSEGRISDGEGGSYKGVYQSSGIANVAHAQRFEFGFRTSGVVIYQSVPHFANDGC